MKFLVTGGLGFIGSNIVLRLVSNGHDITVLDNLHTGSETNISAIKDKIKIIHRNAGDVKNINERFDTIFHNGIYSSSPMYNEKPHLVGLVIDEFISLLEYARKNNTKIVFASSSSVYNGLKPPHREDMPLKVTDYYTEGRIAMERLAELYNKLYGTKVIALRYFSVYGLHEEAKKQYANLITQFLWALQKDEPIVVYGDGKQTRDFIYVDDVIDANLKAADANIGFGIYNIGTGKSYSINDMIRLLEKHTGKKAELQYVENKIKNYVQDTLADATKAEKELGFKAKITIEDGITRLIAV